MGLEKDIKYVCWVYIMNWGIYIRLLFVVLGLGSCVVSSRLPKMMGRGASTTGGASTGGKRTPIGENQIKYCEYLSSGLRYNETALLDDASIVVGVGPAGCGKTLFACHAAVSALVEGEVDRIIITRPTVSVDEELGFLPGTLENKMDPWLRPVFDVLGDFYSASEVRRLVDDGVVEIAPLAYMRGRTFRRSFIIADEMQNSSPNQMLMMLTRIGERSKMVITGDLRQSDRSGLNGLADLHSRLKKSADIKGIRWVEFDVGDVQRSAVVSVILNLYDTEQVGDSGFRNRDKGNTDSAMIPKGDSVWGL